MTGVETGKKGGRRGGAPACLAAVGGGTTYADDVTGEILILGTSRSGNSTSAIFRHLDGGDVSISVDADTSGQMAVEWIGTGALVESWECLGVCARPLFGIIRA